MNAFEASAGTSLKTIGLWCFVLIGLIYGQAWGAHALMLTASSTMGFFIVALVWIQRTAAASHWLMAGVHLLLGVWVGVFSAEPVKKIDLERQKGVVGRVTDIVKIDTRLNLRVMLQNGEHVAITTHR